MSQPNQQDTVVRARLDLSPSGDMKFTVKETHCKQGLLRQTLGAMRHTQSMLDHGRR